MITGRNDPCPCGSGKKYKKCCLQADMRIDQDEIVGADREPMQNDKSARIAGLDIHPYAIVRMVMNPSADILSRLSKRDIAALKDRWSIARMAQLDTSEIVSRLHDLSIDGTKSAFLPLAEGRMSAWSIGVTWSDRLPRSPAMDDEDFICLAACELWKRYCPERPSIEMLDDWVAEGYDRSEARENSKAADVWLRVWDVIRSRIQPSMTTFEAADAVFAVTQNFNNWIQDFTMALENAAIGNRKYADIGIRLTRSTLDQFVDENTDTLLNFRCDLGRFLFLADRCDEGEDILQAVIRAHPEKACGYVVLSDELETHARGRSDYSRAIALLEQALSYPVKDADEWDIDKRLVDLRANMPGDASKNEKQTGERMDAARSNGMKNICRICGGKAQRRCARQGMADICSLCCAKTRGEDCDDCRHYTDAQQYRANRQSRAASPDGHFIAEINPEVDQAVNDALELAKNGQINKARTVVTGLLRKHPRNHTVCFGMGVLCALKEEHKEAIGWFDKATGIFPYFVEAHFNKAVAYQRQLDIANAIRAFRKVVEVGDPGEPEVKQAQSLLDHMDKTLRRNDGVDLDTFLESHDEFNRAFALMEQGEWASALEGFRACIAMNERNAPSHGNMGLCLAKLGRKADALTALDRALEIDPRYEPAMTNRVAVARMAEGRPMDITDYKSIEYGKECVLREKSHRRPFFAKLTALFTNRR